MTRGERRSDGTPTPILLLDDFIIPGTIGLIATAAVSLVLAGFAVNLFQCAILFLCFRSLARLKVAVLFVRVTGSAIGWALLCGAVCMLGLVLLGSLLQWSDQSPQIAGEAVTVASIVPQFLLVALAAPLVEEIYFRGALFGWLRQRLAVGWAVLWSALIFALFHGKFYAHPDLWGLFDTAAIMISGMIMAALYQRYGSLWPSVVMHGGYNATALLLALGGH